jgi:hypothetical protein
MYNDLMYLRSIYVLNKSKINTAHSSEMIKVKQTKLRSSGMVHEK